MRNILVTGGAGFIGSYLANAYLRAGHRVVIVDDLSTGREARVPDGAVLESACAWMERWSAGCGALRSGTARFSSSVDRLGRSRRFGARVTADRRPFLGKSGSGVVGHPQDRRTRGPARALLGRASRAPTGLGRAVRASA